MNKKPWHTVFSVILVNSAHFFSRDSLLMELGILSLRYLGPLKPQWSGSTNPVQLLIWDKPIYNVSCTNGAQIQLSSTAAGRQTKRLSEFPNFCGLYIFVVISTCEYKMEEDEPAKKCCSHSFCFFTVWRVHMTISWPWHTTWSQGHSVFHAVHYLLQPCCSFTLSLKSEQHLVSRFITFNP